MLQDIFPKVMNNSYLQKPLTADSLIFSIKDDAALFNINSETRFPRYEELEFQSDFELDPNQPDAIFLFEIDGIDCFLVRHESIKAHEPYSYESLFNLRAVQPKHLAYACMTARHLNSWYSANRYCGTCGEALERSKVERSLLCKHCENTVYPKISPAIIVAVHRDDELLLTKYADRPYKNFALIAGYIEIGETVEDAIRREVREEVGLEIKNLRYYKSQPWGYSDSLLMGFFAELDGDQDIILDTFELSEAVWMPRDEIEATLDDVSLTNEMIVHFKHRMLEPVLSVKEVTALEKRIEAQGTSLYELMHRAGLSVAQWIRKTLEPTGPVVILCGSGNNGGDGWVIADFLASWNYMVSLVTAHPADVLKAEPARTTALEVLAKEHAQLSFYLDPQEEQLANLIGQASVVVDSLLGTGFDGSLVKDPYNSWIVAVNEAKASKVGPLVVAVDVPSGLSAENGKAAPSTVQADTTITMLSYKPGLLKESSRRFCGDIQLASIASLDGLL